MNPHDYEHEMSIFKHLRFKTKTDQGRRTPIIKPVPKQMFNCRSLNQGNSTNLVANESIKASKAFARNSVNLTITNELKRMIAYQS